MIFFGRNLALLCSLLILNFIVIPQAPAQEINYEWFGKKDIPLLSVGAAGTVTSLVLRNQNVPLMLEEVNDLNAEGLLALERNATDNYSLSYQRASDVFLTTSYAFPLSALLFPKARQNFGMITIMMAESIMLNEMFTGITKNLVNRPRPYAYNAELTDDIRTEGDNNLSFFSGHTSYTAMFSFFSAQVLDDYIDNPTTRGFVWAGAIIWPAATGYFRYAGGKHFITDVVVGYAVGAAIGYFIPRLHEVESEETSLDGFHLDRDASQPLRLVFVF